MLVMSPFMRRRTPQAAELHAKYKALKNYLEDFGRLDEKPPDAVVLWEHFLVLAVVFGIADKVMENMKVKIPEVMQDPGFTHDELHGGVDARRRQPAERAQQRLLRRRSRRARRARRRAAGAASPAAAEVAAAEAAAAAPAERRRSETPTALARPCRRGFPCSPCRLPPHRHGKDIAESESPSPPAPEDTGV